MSDMEQLIGLLEKRLKVLNLAGKDYFTEVEAAEYCGLSLSKFRKIRKQNGIMAGKFGGKIQYRRADLQAAKEKGFKDVDLPR